MLIESTITASDSKFEELTIAADRDALTRRRWRGAAVDGKDFAFALTDPRIDVDVHVSDGDAFATGDVLASVTGPARAEATRGPSGSPKNDERYDAITISAAPFELE